MMGVKLLTALTNDWARNSAKAMIVWRNKLSRYPQLLKN